MPLIASVSGIRGVFGDGLDPAVLTRYAAAFGAWVRQRRAGRGGSGGAESDPAGRPRVVVGRDGRITGDVCARIVTATLQAAGCDVVDVGLATTPSVAMGVLKHEADGAIILSASHNPAEWNALKLLDRTSEFLGPDEGAEVLALADEGVAAHTVGAYEIGTYETDDVLDYHVQKILDLPYVDPEAIAGRGFKVVVDGINSVGAFALPALLDALGVTDVEVLNADVTGRFAHNPEPLPAHIGQILDRVRESGADLGVIVDPDADRLAFVQDSGVFFGEELTQVVAADFLLAKQGGAVATNLSSSRAIEDVAARHGATVHRSPVGEIHVVRAMQANDAVIGGEGNGGVILPDLHYGRDALAGVALVLQHLAETGQSLSDVRAGLPDYAIAKHKVQLTDDMDADALLAALAERYAGGRVSTVDGVKVDLDEGWAHVRKSNTEPILRVYTEAGSPEAADALAERFKAEVLGEA
ncbi:phosphoglucosamine mutase [Rubrivirga litoralis]|uniref:Phosphoglucosamine mutase n=1 Tax=Rubrivirga litoralis TaxID=3075598 RepID=A0ABU3BMJ6_9BACT|nr:phosphoglucosamine mutase [Rubrivirga sp. F394]MDT0630522.1 phosphoglucosamine mutase [Rubrivirga sp. F394]